MKGMFAVKNFVILIAVAALAFGAACTTESSTPTKVQEGVEDEAGSTETTPTSAPQTEFAVGDKVEFKGNTVTVHAVEPWTSDNEFLAPDPGRRYLTVDVEGCGGSDGFSQNPFNWELQMPDNTRATAEAGWREPTLNHTNLSSGECVRGWVTFEAPAAVDPSFVVYTEPTFFSGTKVRWKV